MAEPNHKLIEEIIFTLSHRFGWRFGDSIRSCVYDLYEETKIDESNFLMSQFYKRYVGNGIGAVRFSN